MRYLIFVLSVTFAFCACDVLVPGTGEEHQPCFGDGTCLGALQCSSIDNTCIGIEEDCSGRVCGSSPVHGFDCGTCSGATDYCTSEGQCIGDCAGRECGQSPNAGFDCGTCSGATDYCTAEGQCVDDCAGRECGLSLNEGFDCGTCSGATETCVYGQCEDLGHAWRNPPAGDQMKWQEAVDYCDSLTLDGHDDWRLPTISELRSLIRGCPATETGGSCGVTDSCLSNSPCLSGDCGGCLLDGGPAGGCYWPDGMEGWCDTYWSSSEHQDFPYNAWVVAFGNGHVSAYGTQYELSVRCVR